MRLPGGASRSSQATAKAAGARGLLSGSPAGRVELLVCRWLPGTRGLITLAWGSALLAASWKSLLGPKASFVNSDG